MDWLYILFLMFIYAALPCIPAVILRVKFPETAIKWIVFCATVFGIICLIIIAAGGETLLEKNEWLSTFAQCVLTSSVPVLYCVAFCGIKGMRRWEIWLATIPSLMYCMSFFLRHMSVYGFMRTVEYIFYDPSIITVIFMSAVFLIWAVLCIIVSRMVYKLIISHTNKKKEKTRRKKYN